MSISYQQKNENILNRFESKEGKGSCRAYIVELICGLKMTMISMNGDSFEDIEKGQKIRWGKRFKKISHA